MAFYPKTTMLQPSHTECGERRVSPNVTTSRAAFIAPILVRQNSLPHRTACTRIAPTMLRVQKGRRPEDWEKKRSTLSGRFLPMDPRDEMVLDVLEQERIGIISVEDGFLPVEKKWSRRSEAARKRWADPAYREKVLTKRAAKRAAKKPQKVEIGRMDSITLCDDDKAKQINDYVRSNQLRSEKVTAFHKNRREWMEQRLSDSPARLSDEEYVRKKKEKQARRKMFALVREEKARAKRAELEAGKEVDR